MQRMKTNAAPVWIKDGRCQQMVEIDQHGEQENHIYLTPVIPKKQPCYQARHKQMEAVMNESLQDFLIFLRRESPV